MIPSSSTSKLVPIDQVVHSLKQKTDKAKKLRAEKNNSANIKCALCGKQIFGNDLRKGPYSAFIHPSAARILSRWCNLYPEIKTKLEESKMPFIQDELSTEKYDEAARELFRQFEEEALIKAGRSSEIDSITDGSHCGNPTRHKTKRVRVHSSKPLLTNTNKDSLPAWEPEITQEMYDEARRYNEKRAKLASESAAELASPTTPVPEATHPVQMTGIQLLAFLTSQL